MLYITFFSEMRFPTNHATWSNLARFKRQVMSHGRSEMSIVFMSEMPQIVPQIVLQFLHLVSCNMRKPVFGGFRPGPTQIKLYKLRQWLETGNFWNCTIRAAKTKVLIRCAVTAQLICFFIFACVINQLLILVFVEMKFSLTVNFIDLCLMLANWRFAF